MFLVLYYSGLRFVNLLKVNPGTYLIHLPGNGIFTRVYVLNLPVNKSILRLSNLFW